MKIRIMIVLMFVVLGFQQVNATLFSNYLPGGKNYLDGDNIVVNNGILSTIDPFKVKPNTVYTFSLPSENIVEMPYITIWSTNTIYIEGEASSLGNCILENDYTSCTFTTSTDELIEIEVQAFGLQQYYQVYGLVDFQFEEGPIKTAYEAYYPSFTDVTSPEFEGSGAFIKAYYEAISLTDIISQHIVVYDDIDGDISSSIEIVNDPYTANMYTVGEYPVDLQATDSSGNTASFQLLIIVKDEIKPSINGPSEVNVNVDDHPLIEDVIALHYNAIDGHDGNLNITVINDNYSDNKFIIGIYTVDLYTVDSSGNDVLKSIVIDVVDVIAPDFQSSNMITVQMSSPKTIDTIINELVITDNYDSPEQIIIEILNDSYTNNEMIVGTYEVEVQISDTSLNNITIFLHIDVVDDIAPTISGPSTITTSYVNPYTMNDIIGMLLVNDNYDVISTNDLQIITDTYTTRDTEVGTYQIVFSITDSSNNVSTHELAIHLIDDQAPIIYLDNYLITVTSQASFSPLDALNILINNQELPDGDYEIETIKDDYTGNEHKPGTYQYTLKFIDKMGHEIEKDFVIKVADNHKSSIDKTLLIRNIIVYSGLLGFSGFVVYKLKK